MQPDSVTGVGAVVDRITSHGITCNLCRQRAGFFTGWNGNQTFAGRFHPSISPHATLSERSNAKWLTGDCDWAAMMFPRNRSGSVQQLGVPLECARSVVVLVHGRDQDVEWLTRNVVERFPANDITWLVPSAPHKSWYPGRFDDPPEVNRPDIDNAVAVVRDCVQQAVDAVGIAKVVVAGFSQGACVSAEFARRNPRRYGALMLWTGVPLDWSAPQGSFQGTPVYLSVASHDPWLSVDVMKRAAALFWLSDATVRTVIHSGAEHEVRDGDLDHLATVVQTLGDAPDCNAQPEP